MKLTIELPDRNEDLKELSDAGLNELVKALQEATVTLVHVQIGVSDELHRRQQGRLRGLLDEVLDMTGGER